MDLRKIRKLIEIFQATDLTEIEIQEGEDSIRLTRGMHGVPQVAQSPAGAGTSPLQKLAEISMDDEADEDSEYQEVRAPMVGTFYLSPSPDEPPYVKVGDQVQKGKVLCLIEAMKIYNPIEADLDGEIVKILKEDGEPVEFGEVLFLVAG